MTPLWTEGPSTGQAVDSARLEMKLLGLSVTVSLRPVRDELLRREAADLGPVLKYLHLQVLAELPVDMPVPVHLLDRRTAAVLRRLPEGAVDLANGVVTRRAVPAVRVTSVVLRTTRCMQGLEQVSRFAPFAERSIVLPRLPRNLDGVRAEAAYYGVGIFIDSDQDARWLASPAPFRPTRYSPASWLFDERVLAAANGAV